MSQFYDAEDAPSPNSTTIASKKFGKEHTEDEEKPNPFSQYYAQLLHQQNMLQDSVRTSTYQNAIVNNANDFFDKVILDVGTGSGILAFFAIQAGARKVYAVEASGMAKMAQILVDSNNLKDKIVIINNIVENVKLEEKVDIIISEPIGFLLVHERMLESYVAARDKFLKPEGKMFPSTGDIVFAPYTDDTLYQEQVAKASFWENSDFYGVDLNALHQKSLDEYFGQPVVGYFHSSCLISNEKVTYPVDFKTVSCEELQKFSIPFEFTINKTSIMHGFGCWFDIDFRGTDEHVILSTSPDHAGTHWYQCRLMFREPIAVNASQVVRGGIKFTANDKYSYYLDMYCELVGTDIKTESRVNLHDQMYHYLQSSEAAGTNY